jgi:tetratricopeptide (TPR) repeat protein
MRITDGGRRLFIEEREGRAVPRLLPLVVAAGILFVIALFWKPVAPACVTGIGTLLTVAVARENRFLLGAALLAFGVRALLAAAFHWMAALDLSALHALQTAPVDGYRFWILAPDSTWYHSGAVRVVAAWRQGTEFPGGTAPEYFIFTALTYLLFGSNPLNAVLWNALFGSLAVVAGYRIAERLAGPSAARPAAVLIALWPSAVLWSSQLLKDAACLWLILLLLYLTMRAVEPPLPAASRWRALARWAGLLLVLFAAALAMHRFRYYILLVLIPAPVVFVVHALIRRSRDTAWRVVAACAVIGVMFLGASASRRIDLERVFAPRYPEIGHVNLGVMHQSRGDLDTAQAHYERALALVQPAEYPPALKQLGTIAIARHDPSKAIAYFERYLAREPGDAQVRVVLNALLRPETTAAGTVDKRIQPADISRRPSPRRESTEEVPTTAMPRGPSEVTLPPALIPTRVPVPPKPFEITGPRSDYLTGTRAFAYGDVVGALRRARAGFTGSRGYSTIDSEVQFRDYGDVLRYLPRAVANVLLAPYPWQWFDVRGGTGPFKALSAVEALLLYACLIPLIVGLAMVVRRGSPDALYLAVFVVAMTVLLGLVVSNLGTLFRLRLESLLPLFAAGGLGWTWLLHRRGRT